VKASAREIFDSFFRRIVSDSEASFQIDYRGAESADKEYYAFSCALSYLGGSSLAVNQALMVSETIGAIPVTDSYLHHLMVCNKYKAAANAAPSVWNSFPDLHPSVPLI
jgi:hypothetical protein